MSRCTSVIQSSHWQTLKTEGPTPLALPATREPCIAVLGTGSVSLTQQVPLPSGGETRTEPDCNGPLYSWPAQDLSLVLQTRLDSLSYDRQDPKQ